MPGRMDKGIIVDCSFTVDRRLFRRIKKRNEPFPLIGWAMARFHDRTRANFRPVDQSVFTLEAQQRLSGCGLHRIFNRKVTPLPILLQSAGRSCQLDRISNEMEIHRDSAYDRCLVEFVEERAST